MQTKHYIVGLALAALALFGVNNLLPTKTHAQLGAVQTWAGTAGGTASAITFTVHNVASLNDLLGVPIRFIPSANSLGATTLAVGLDSGGPLTATAVLRKTTNIGLQAPSGSELIIGVMSELTYDGTEFVITSNVDMTPVGQSIDMRTTGAAPAGYLLEDGTCASQTTFTAALFAAIGTTYNSGAPSACTGSTFAVPFANGTASIALDTQGANTANRVTSGGSGCALTSVGVFCGVQNTTLLTSNLPAYTPAGSVPVTDPGHGHDIAYNQGAGNGTSNYPATNASSLSNSVSNAIWAGGGPSGLPVIINTTGITAGFNGNAQGGTSTPFSKIQPLLGVHKAIKL